MESPSEDVDNEEDEQSIRPCHTLQSAID